VGKIDEAIKQKEELIQLLGERKQILIQNAVTKGLNPNTPMKPSGIEWIGDIPEHWEVKPGFCFIKERKTKNIGMKRSTVLSLSYGNVIIKPKEKLTGLVPESFETYQLVDPGDIIIRPTDMQNDHTSLRTGLAKDHGIITSAYLNLEVKDNQHSEYIYNYLHNIDTNKVIYGLGSGLRQNLDFGDFKRFPFLLVPKEEQQKIVEHIQTQSTKIDQAIDQAKEGIEKLKEYKSSLINSAVTGKIRVNG